MVRLIDPATDATTPCERADVATPISDGAVTGRLRAGLAALFRLIGNARVRAHAVLLATLAASLAVVPSAFPEQTPGAAAPAAGAPSAAAPPASRYHPDRFAGRAGTYYRVVWGVDSLTVQWTESGEVIRFSYRVLDPAKAAPLNDKRAEPKLNDPKAGVQLVVPSMEKIGQLRQSTPPEAGKSYWMAFSNKGRLVKKGDRVDVVIGNFQAEGLVVD